MRVLTLSCVAVLVLACGADAAPPPLTHAALLARADTICERYAALLQRPTGGRGSLGEPDYDAAWLKLFRRQRGALAALRPTGRDVVRYRGFVDSLPAMERAARSLMEVLERRGSEAASQRALRRFLVAHTASSRLARAIGLRRCPGA